MGIAKGSVIHGEFSSSDASALTEPNSRFTLYPAGSTTPITLGSGDEVQITALILTTTATLRVEVYDGADNVVGAGEQVVQAQVATNTTVMLLFPQPHHCQLGTYVKVKTNGAGGVEATLNATLFTKPSGA